MEYFLGCANLGPHNNKNTLFNIMLIIWRIKLTLLAAYELDFLICPDRGVAVQNYRHVLSRPLVPINTGIIDVIF